MKALTAVLAILVLSAGVASAQQEVVEYYHLDAIGNVRAVSNQANVVIERHDYLPFGEECTTGPCSNNLGAGAGQPRKFTGKERDQETGLDYFGARYYGSKIGRFTTVDPVYTWKDNLLDPQRWNRYAYGRDNPLRYVDPDGRVGRDITAAQVRELQRRAAEAGHGDAGFILDTALPAVGLTVTLGPLVVMAAEAAPAVLTEALIAGGRCGVSAGCRGFIQDLAEGASGVPGGPRLPSGITSLEGVLTNPRILQQATPQEIEALAKSSPGWRIGTLGRGSHEGQGLLVREFNAEGNATGRMIQWHPGGGHHGPEPYWKVSSGEAGTVRVGPQFKNGPQ